MSILKREIGFILSKSNHKWLNAIAVDVNRLLFHFPERQQFKCYGEKHNEKNFFVVRSRDYNEGLLSAYFWALGKIEWCFQKGYIPIVDFENYKTQYNINCPVQGKMNAWEYYFQQPSNYTLEEIYQCKNVWLSGWKIGETREKKPDVSYGMIQRAPIKKYIHKLSEQKVAELGIDDAMGVFLRGTDYTSIKPVGHFVQPTIKMMFEKIDTVQRDIGKKKIFLATEDEKIWSEFKQKYGDNIITSDENLIRGYSGKDYISNEIKAANMYQFGLDYLVKMLCLSQCGYLVASKATGSEFAALMNNGKYRYKFFFELGVY